MSLHESILSDIHRLIDTQGGASIITPASLANALQAEYGAAAADARIAYTSLEGLKQLCRRALSGRYSAESDETEAHNGELFSGHLQTRYPTPHKRGEEVGYKLLVALTDKEIEWNEHALESSANARLIHARALAAYRESRVQAA